tara:strand:+ start:450 stop:698 length:249 start_codon:yes stop_codon:yes gene_type:complete
LLSLAAAWAHYRLSSHTAKTRRLARLALVVIGGAFAWVMAFVYTGAQGLAQVLIFISAFGLVHVPAACVLQLKHWRGIPRQD